MRLVIASLDLGLWMVLGERDEVLYLGTRHACERFMESECVPAI